MFRRLSKTTHKLRKQLYAATQKARLDLRGEDDRVTLGHLTGLPGCPHAEAQLQTQIRNVGHQSPCNEFQIGFHDGVVKQHQINVGKGSYIASAVAAVGNQSDVGSHECGVFGREFAQRVFKEPQNGAIQKIGESVRNLNAG